MLVFLDLFTVIFLTSSIGSPLIGKPWVPFLGAGLARGHRGNPAASLRVENLYGTPILFSGNASLFLSKSEISVLSLYFKSHLQRLLKLKDKTPESFIFFMSGMLPAEAILHKKQLSLFGMITRLEDNILNKIAKQILTSAPDSAKSWFIQIKKLCSQYKLPHPITLLEQPLTKLAFKELVSFHILDFWTSKLRNDAEHLSSLTMFQPQYMSLLKPHPILSTCGNNPFQVNKALVQIQMLSGRYRTEKLCRFWSINKEGICQNCPELKQQEDITHILLVCPALDHARTHVTSIWNESSSESPVCQKLIQDIFTKSPEEISRFLLDCSSSSSVIEAVQDHGSIILEKLFYLTRLWTYSVHRQRLKLLGRL